MRIVILFFCLLSVHCAYAQHRALLIGVAKYPEESGWSRIHSDNDIRLMYNSLGKEWEISQLLDESATRKGIEDSFKSLNNEIEPGDTILVLFSGHGQQMLSDDASEVDGLDEAIIPYDAKSQKSDQYDGENHLRDNDFSKMIDKLREKAGNNGFVLVLLDACHSDSMDKGDDEETGFRGTSEIFGMDDDLTAEELAEIRTKMMKKDPIGLENGNLADVAYISACQSYQKNWEYLAENGETFGRLTWAFTQAYRKDGFGNINMLLKNIRKEMAEISSWSGQKPEIRASFEIGEDRQSSEIEKNRQSDEKNTPSHLPVFLAIGASLLTSLSLLLNKKRK